MIEDDHPTINQSSGHTKMIPWAWAPHPRADTPVQKDYSSTPSLNHDDWYSCGLCNHLFGAVSRYTQIDMSQPKPLLTVGKGTCTVTLYTSAPANFNLWIHHQATYSKNTRLRQAVYLHWHLLSRSSIPLHHL